ncbi:MAG TPA: glycosyltransferase 87 family protein, partial [Candidatus Limnocylindrales bacterium]|nr:glycosyltransferase 87 family protein [Candidatus Limnocylindrales bacterium]
AHRDIKPANLMVKDGHLFVIDPAFAQVRPSPWREAVDLANMMLVLAVRTDAPRVYRRALQFFTEDDIAEAFAAARGVASPSQLRAALKADGRSLIEEFRALGPDRRPIALQRWSVRRFVLAGGLVVAAIIALMSGSLAIQALAGNVNGFLLGALVLVWLLRDHPKVAGGLLAIAIAIKLTPVIVLLWAVAARRWRLAAATVGWLVIIGIVSLLGGGLQNHLDWLASVPASAPSPTSLAGLLGIPSAVVLLGCAVVAIAVGFLANERIAFSVAVVAAAVASPALYLGTLGIAAAAAAPWLRRAGEPPPWRGLVRAAPTVSPAAPGAAPPAVAPGATGTGAGAADGATR